MDINACESCTHRFILFNHQVCTLHNFFCRSMFSKFKDECPDYNAIIEWEEDNGR